MFKVALADTPSSLVEATSILERIRSENPKHWPNGLSVGHFDGGLYLVRDKQASAAVGFVGWQERQEGMRKIGYYSIGILPEHRQNGFARDAVATLLTKKAKRVDLVRAMIVEGNTPSVRLADGLGVSRKMVKKADRSDKGGWAGIGGAALLGDTAYNLHQGGQVGQQLIDLHKRVLDQPQQLLDADVAANTLREYGQAASRGSRLRILGVPIGKWFQYAPPSVLSNGQAGLGPGDMLRYHTRPGTLAPNAREKIQQAVHHYDGYLKYPEQAQLMELVTGRSFGQPKDVSPAFQQLGVDRNFVSNLLHNEVKDPLSWINKRVQEVGGAEGKHQLGKLYYEDLKRLFTGDAAAGTLHNFGPLQKTKAYLQGSAAYGGGGVFASKFSKLTALAALLSGGYGLHRLAKDKPSFFKHSSTTPETELGLSAGALAGGGYALNRARAYMPSNLLVSTAGHLTPPFAGVDTGAGHVTPAKAIYEALAAHPAVQSGEFRADIALRTMNQQKLDAWRAKTSPSQQTFNPGTWFEKDWLNPFQLERGSNPFTNHGERHALMTLDSGFGAHLDTGGVGARSPEFTSNPAGRIGFVPDPVGGQLGLDKRRLIFGTQQPKTRPADMITFGGPKAPDANSLAYNVLEHFDYHPALSEGVLTAARKHLEKPEVAHSVLGDLGQRLRAGGDAASADLLEQSLASGKHFIGVSGSSRGDLVASRAAELQAALKAKGLQDKFQVVAMMAKAKDNAADGTHQLLKNFPEVLQLGHTDKIYGAGKGSENMYRLLNAMKYHWGSTGASAQGEAGLMSVPTGFVTDYEAGKSRMFDAFKNQGVELPEGTRKLLDDVKLNDWNASAIADIKSRLHGSGAGMDSVNHVDELMPHLEKLLKDPNSMDMTARAKLNLEKAVANKRSLADLVVEQARKLRRATGGMALQRGLLGAGLLGLGAYGAGNAVTRMGEPGERLQKGIQNLKERFS